jgi:hypothetical protein
LLESEEPWDSLLESCGVISLPTRGDGYAGAVYVFVRRFFLIHRSTEMPNAIRMMVPKAAPTIAAIGAEWASLIGAGATADGVVVPHMLCVTVLKAVDSGCSRLTVKL